MELTRRPEGLTVETDAYALTYDTTRAQGPHALAHMYVDLVFANGVGAELFVPSGCDRDEMIDRVVSLDGPEVEELDGCVRVTFSGTTTLWEEAEYVFECREDHVLYYYRVRGRGALDNARFFEGFIENDPRMDEAFFPYYCGPGRNSAWHRPWKFFARSSVPKFHTLYTSEITTTNEYMRCYYENAHIRAAGDRAYKGGDWLVTPPPFLYMIGPKSRDAWVSMGLLVNVGEYSFQEYQYFGGEGWGLDLTYDGYTKVDGWWDSPRILFQMSGDIYEGLGKYVTYLRDNGYVNKADRSNAPRWWFEPIFGGWGEQMFHSDHWEKYCSSASFGWSGSSAGGCTQEAYEHMLARLDEKGIDPTILIVDNRWYKVESQLDVDPLQWPDMRGFIDRQHARGRKVILWVSPFTYCLPFNGKDIPVAEHMYSDPRKRHSLAIDTDVFYKRDVTEMRKVHVPSKYKEEWHNFDLWIDPLNPDYQQRIRRKVHHMLSPDGLDADGIEYDYTHRFPVHRGTVPICGRENNLWGVEFLHKTLELYYAFAKQAKPDALMITHSYNPYFDDVVDMLRMQDIYTDRLSVVPQYDHRAKVARLSCPGVAIHSDQYPMPSVHAWREYAKYQKHIGNPCLYYVTGIETTKERFAEEDYEMIRSQWAEHHERLDERFGPREGKGANAHRAEAEQDAAE